MMNLSYWQRAAFLFLLFTYSLLFYFILTFQQGIDFASFYSAAQTLTIGNNPYQSLFATYLPVTKQLAANLNPPIVLILFNPLTQFGYQTALIIWWLTSFFLGLVAVHLTFKQAFSPDFLRQHWGTLYILYLAFFSTLMNTAIMQLGALLLFCIMLGYHFYLTKKDYPAGLLWGCIIAMKVFPGLLFIYVLHQKRYKLFAIMFCVVAFMTLFPIVLYGLTIYKQYFSMMSKILWYGDNWNASIYGFLFRIFVNARDTTQSHLWVNISYGVLFMICLGWYLKNLTKMSYQQSFAFTLCVMLLLSPFGWLYYFSLLILPLAYSWKTIFSQETVQNKMAWLICLFLLNFPMDYLSSKKMLTLSSKLFLYSFYFYGLVIFTLLFSKQLSTNKPNSTMTTNYLPVIGIIISFGLFIPILSFIGRLFSIDWSK